MLDQFTTVIPERSLTAEEISALARELLDASIADEVKSAFLQAWARRGETAAELAAVRGGFPAPRARSRRARIVERQAVARLLRDGRGGLNLLNISTGVMFVLAALGIPVVKHGNRGITKRSGSADVLEAMGIKIDLAPAKSRGAWRRLVARFSSRRLITRRSRRSRPCGGCWRRRGSGRYSICSGHCSIRRDPMRGWSGVFEPKHVALYQAALEIMKCRASAWCAGRIRKAPG